MDVDGSMFNYKQIQVNVLGTLSDQLLYKSPHDSDNKDDVKVIEWRAEMDSSVYADGTINDSTDTDNYWSVEMAVGFHSLANGSNRVNDKPDESETWFMQFGRTEREVMPQNGDYKKKPNSPAHLWAWQATGSRNWQLQDRWGLVQFKRSMADTNFRFNNWHVYKALFDSFNAMKTYTALNGKSTGELIEIDIPPYLMSNICVDLPEISLYTSGGGSGGGGGSGQGGQDNLGSFNITVRSKLQGDTSANIRDDRYVWFD